jgi:glucose/mannose-6-phosphate isomerase
MIDLDDKEIYRQYDPHGMIEHIRTLPQLSHQAWQMALDFELPLDYSQVNKVVILGMGGSAIGGDLTSSLVDTETKVPIIVNRGYDLPGFVDEQTLVIASSYSGNTEETLSAFRAALDSGAKKLVIATGGRLKEIADTRAIPVFSFDFVGQPRTALPFSFLPILGFIQKLGFIGVKSAEVAEMVAVLTQMVKKINETVPLLRNRAKQLASELHGHLVVIYGGGLLSEVAHRWKTQINENSKAWAFYENFPELNHNAIVGYEFPKESSNHLVVLFLRSIHLSERIMLRQQITAHLLKKAGIRYQFVDGVGITQLTQVMSHVLFGDFVSYYLAILNGIDPSPVETINFLKGALARAKEEL